MQMHTLQRLPLSMRAARPVPMLSAWSATLDASLDIPQTSPSIRPGTATADATSDKTRAAAKDDGHHRPADQSGQRQPQQQRLNHFTTPRLTGHRNQCSACFQAFGGNHGFSLHRIGAFGLDRRCMSPAELQTAGMVQDEAGFWCRQDAPRSRNVRP